VILSDYQLGEDMDTLDLIETMRARAQVFALLVATPTERCCNATPTRAWKW
jgi:hypothetical protein